jgi:hypothetical protein
LEIGRNDPCHCGSGKKYKKCCWAKDLEARSAGLAAEAAAKRAADPDAETRAKEGNASKGPTPTGGLAPRAKGQSPKSPTQLRRKKV